MKTIQFLVLVTIGAFLAGCTTMAPDELVKARSAYATSAAGPAAQLAPAELHKANEALVLAEESFLKDPRSSKTRDLAYIAQRKAELAGAHGALSAEKANKAGAVADFQTEQTEIVKQGKQDLLDSEQKAAETRQNMIDANKRQELIDANKETDDVRQELVDANKKTADAMAQLALLAELKEDERGAVLTLSGSVLFRFNEAKLLPSATVKLQQVADALVAIRERDLIVEGYTDSKGSEMYNRDLSQRRANVVRNFLVERGYPSNRIETLGKGESNPIADNASAEGRANNRRVEIVIKRQ